MSRLPRLPRAERGGAKRGEANFSLFAICRLRCVVSSAGDCTAAREARNDILTQEHQRHLTVMRGTEQLPAILGFESDCYSHLSKGAGRANILSYPRHGKVLQERTKILVAPEGSTWMGNFFLHLQGWR